MDYDTSYNNEYTGKIDSIDSTSNSQKLFFWGILSVSCVFAAYLYYTGSPKLAISVVGTVIAISIIISPQVGLYVYFAWHALDSVLLTSSEAMFTPAKALSFFIILIYIASIWRIQQKILTAKPIIILMVAFGLFGLAITPFAIYRFSALRYSLQIIVHVLLLLGALQLLDNEKRVYTAFLWCFLSGVMATVAMLITGGVSQEFSRATLGEYTNPNTTANALAVSLMAITGLFCFKRSWSKLFLMPYVAAAVLILIAMMKTGSRAPLVAVFFAFSLGGILAKGVNIIKRLLLPALLVVILVGGVLYILSLRMLDEKSQDRLEALVGRQINAGSEGDRLDIVKTAFSVYMEHNPAFGWGFGNTRRAMSEYRGWDKDIHNSIVGSFVDSGPIGFILFSGGLLLLFFKIRGIRDPAKNTAATMIYIFFILESLTHTTHFSKWFWIPITLCLLLAEQDCRDNEAEVHFCDSLSDEMSEED